MRVGNHGPALVPVKHQAELEKMSKAALMDMVWSLAGQTVECAEDPSLVIGKIRDEWDIVKVHREPARYCTDDHCTMAYHAGPCNLRMP